jgi:serine phosphatase RsbU (regulator of sigma subunit)
MAAQSPRVVFVSDRPDPNWGKNGWAVVERAAPIPPADLIVCDGPPVAAATGLVALTEGYVRAATSEINRELQQAYSRLNADLEVARRLQESFLPRTLPGLGGVRFAVARSSGRAVAGDCYDVARLDEHHLGFYLADAMGHGIPAALLAIYLKKAVVGKHIDAGGYRLLEPGEVLGRLNRELVQLQLADDPYFTMIYGLIDCRTGTAALARAAHPPAVFVPRAGTPEFWSPTGSLLGVFESTYADERRQFATGDRLLLMTDGFVPDPTRGHAILEVVASGPPAPLDDWIADLGRRLPRAEDDATLLALEFSVES